MKFLKKPAGSVRFRFYNQKTEKPTEPDKKPEKNRAKLSQNRAKPEKPSQNRENRAKTGKTEPNWFEPVFALKKPNRTETGRFDSVSVFFFKKKNFDLVTFFD